jgi:penicillin-binding protein 1A
VRRRFWTALAIGGLVGGGAVVGFAPVVRSQIEAKAERYGAAVEVQQITPGWSGVRLRGVDVTVAEMPGVKIWFDDLVVGWDKRLRSVSGGKVSAVGELPELAASAMAWRRKRFRGGGESSGGARRLGLEGVEVDWSESASDRSRSVHLTGVDVTRGGDTLVVATATGKARWGGAELSVTSGRLVLAKSSEGYRVRELTTKALSLDVSVTGPDALAASLPMKDGAPAPPPVPVGSASGTLAAASSPKVVPAPGQEAPPHGQVLRARRLHAQLLELGRRADGLVEEDAHIGVNGATARLAFGEEVLNLGPGAFRVVRDASDIVLALEPRAEERTSGQALTFSLRLPLEPDDEGRAVDARPVEGRIRGGPVWLSMLGVKEGDFGLKDVQKSAVAADLRLVLPPDGKRLSLEGSGKVHDLALESARLAPSVLEGVELAWRARLDYHLDGSRVVVHDAEVDLGAIRGLFRGSIERTEHAPKRKPPQGQAPTTKTGIAVRLDFEVPLVECQRAFESIPKAMVSRLEGMRFAGSFAAKGHAKFDTADLARDYDVDWDGTMSCRVLDVPSALHVSRFRGPFDKLIYTSDKREKTAKFGPETPGWVPLSAISRYMVGAVLTTEDGRFFRHAGFDQEAIVNSIKENLVNKRFVRGASTISMQLTKNLYLPRTKTIARKLQETILTMYLEQELTKDEMMELYLNVIEYAPDVYGIGPAAGHYFNTHAGRLSLGQSLYLASILSNPLKSYFGAGGAVIPSRMSYIHTLMKIVNKIGRISDEELDAGLRETVVFGSSPIMAPPEDPYEDAIEPSGGDGGSPTQQAAVDPWAG